MSVLVFVKSGSLVVFFYFPPVYVPSGTLEVGRSA